MKRYLLLFVLVFLLTNITVGCEDPGNAGSQPDVNKSVTPEADVLPTSAITEQPVLTQKKPLRVFGAGSLIIPFDALEKAYEAQHPDVDLLMEYHGSIQVIRHVTELHEKIDVVATADHALMPMLMYQSKNPDTGKPYADWYIRFATNRLSIAYTDRSQFANEITPQNWYSILARDGVKVGIADPRFDASGYRALMAFKLAEQAYHDDQIFNRMIKDKFVMPISIFEEEGFSEITVPEIVETKKGAGIVIRGASIQLIALLESGDLDYAFEYESVIRQHGLKWIDLPETVNLGDANQDPIYSQVQVKLDFRRFASVEPVFKGEQIGYGITIPSSSPEPKIAEDFISFLLGPQGREIMNTNFHPLLDSITCDQINNVPPDLKVYCAKEQ